MPIQFRCQACNQPIEVDDQHAGQVAACPYCQNVVTVPTESNYQPECVPTARPAAEAPDHGTPPPPPGSLHVGQTLLPRQQAARTFGNYALICTILMLLCFGAAMMQIMASSLTRLSAHSTTQPITLEETNAIQLEVMNELAHSPWFLGTMLGSAFFGVVGLALAVTSVLQSRQGNWRGILSLVLCGLYVLCICGGNLINLISGGTLLPT